MRTCKPKICCFGHNNACKGNHFPAYCLYLCPVLAQFALTKSPRLIGNHAYGRNKRAGNLKRIKIMKDYKTYIFDLDGTLLNTLGDLAASTNYALRRYGQEEHSLDNIRRFVGNGVRKLIERALPDGDRNPLFDDVFALFKQHYLEHGLDTTGPYPGMMELLKELSARGKNMAVVSNKFDAATKELVAHFFGDYIKVAVGERENVRRKPAPDSVEEALHMLGVGKDDAVYIGDSDVDVATARNSHLPCISVLWGFRDKDFLTECGATTFVTKPEEILG